MTKTKAIKCKLKQCLNVEDGKCDVPVPTMLKKIKPGSVKCPFYDNDFEKTCEEFKKNGGVLAAIARMKGKRTASELKEVRKAMRKPRKDKGIKRKEKKS